MGFILGLIVGSILAALGFVLMMKNYMLCEIESGRDFDETVDILKKAIEESGWAVISEISMDESLAQAGYKLDKTKIIEFGNPNYANTVLNDVSMIFTAIMPCRFGVYKKGERVFVSRMNVKLMGPIFGKKIYEIMKKVASDEESFINRVKKR